MKGVERGAAPGFTVSCGGMGLLSLRLPRMFKVLLCKVWDCT
jgi:hypothetical protein